MPPASHRLDLCLLPPTPDEGIEGAEAVLAAWRRRGWVEADGPGAGADDLIEGGFARVWLDRPGAPTLYVNQQGGFRVACPVAGSSIIPAFQSAVAAWRRGGERCLACPACGARHDLDALAYQPPAGIAQGALVLADVQVDRPRSAALAELADSLGPVRVIGRRVGR